MNKQGQWTLQELAASRDGGEVPKGKVP
jgi:hypothetical protein